MGNIWCPLPPSREAPVPIPALCIPAQLRGQSLHSMARLHLPGCLGKFEVWRTKEGNPAPQNQQECHGFGDGWPQELPPLPLSDQGLDRGPHRAHSMPESHPKGSQLPQASFPFPFLSLPSSSGARAVTSPWDTLIPLLNLFMWKKIIGMNWIWDAVVEVAGL